VRQTEQHDLLELQRELTSELEMEDPCRMYSWD
jgi:hypothetical protein